MDNSDKKGGKTPSFNIEQVEIDPSRFDIRPDFDNLPLIATRNLVLFPGVTVTFELTREQARKVASKANNVAFPVGIVCQTDPEDDTPAVTTGLYRYGVFADILNVFEETGSHPVAIVKARGKFRIMGRGTSGSRGGELYARVKPVPDVAPVDTQRYNLTLELIRRNTSEALKMSGDPNHVLNMVSTMKSGPEVVNFLCTNLPFDIKDKIELLSASKAEDRALNLLSNIGVFLDRLRVTEDIVARARRTMDENQRNAFLQNQMEAIRETLYGSYDDDADNLMARAQASGMPESVFETFRKETDKMRRYNPSSPDYSVQYSYLDTLASLPWNNFTKCNNDLSKASEILEADHYGLDKVKERILEQLALLMHNPEGRSPIICLVGAPGVGKTSVGRSIARALGREYGRVSFGGLHDEAEIRGHRRTYIGAMPGRIIDAIKRVGVTNPVILLDEIDKIGNDYKGDPAAALLEVLDPEQNCHFHDNYIDVDFDLSNVLFIATANTLGTIARPLLDRMEIIDISGYLVEEKLEIARRHLIPRALEMHKIEASEFNISDDALRHIISDYTSESGVRALEKRIAALVRKNVLYKMQDKTFPNPVAASDLYELLGLAPHIREQYEGNDIPGVVTGLAWTEIGGEILMAEVSLAPAKEGRLTVTGNLGDVMKESASIAYQWVKSHTQSAGVDPDVIDKNIVHVHFPEGAIPKDGPSAGITIATAMVSALRGCRVAERVAMTGEITLRGRVLPVGGIREKILAAKRAGITDIIMSERNRRDIDDMPAAYLEGLNFHFVDTVDQVLEQALLK